MDSLHQTLVLVDYELRASTVRRALALAAWIAAVERAEFAAPDDPGLDVHLHHVDAALADLRDSVDKL